MQNVRESDSKRFSDHEGEGHDNYIDSCPIGTLVAFRIAEKVKSAKIIKRNRKNKRLKVQTSYGKDFFIDYSDVVWVKLNNRWPRGVYNLLKGITDGEEIKKTEGNANN